MKIVIIGAAGQLGTDISLALHSLHNVIALTHADIHIENMDSCLQVLTNISPDVIINTAAYHHVPKCEQNVDLAFSVNAIGTLNLAKVSQKLNALLIHISTDYVFDGEKKQPYTEKDTPHPLNVYAISKLAGENFCSAYASHYWILRVSGIYGKVPSKIKGGNFVTTMIKLSKEQKEVKVVTDEILTPTCTYDIALAIKEMLNKRMHFANGIYHLSAAGQCSWFDFAQTIFTHLNIQTPLIAAKVNDFPMVVKRPTYSVLDNTKINLQGIYLASWKDGLIRFLKNDI